MDSQTQGSEVTAGQRPGEFCGVVALAESVPVGYRLVQSLRIIQHRGQESAGISILVNGKFRTLRGMGLVNEVFSGVRLERDDGLGIGHVRYSTAGSSVIENAQPLYANIGKFEISVGHNGEIVNASDIKKRLESKGYSFSTNSDTEVILKLLSIGLSKYSDPLKAMITSFKKLVGAYSLNIMINERVFVVRDPNAIRPLVIGSTEFGYGAASESVVFDQLGGRILRDVLPGEIVEITKDGFKSYIFSDKGKEAHCMFEYVYFARPDSIIDGKNVFSVRYELGRMLAKESNVEADYVIPVPDSGRSHAMGYSAESGIPFTEGLIKNRYVDRTFIMPEQSGRERELYIKLNPVRELIDGKKIVLVDDSIIRGNTMRRIVKLLKDSGAKEVHVRVASPPVRYPCYLGIDMKTREQFIASNRNEDEICRSIGADSLRYLSLKGLVEAIGLGKRNLCLGCLTGKYPVKIQKGHL
ncbi:MAG: amidophosphoribosyltransferase [Thermoplasmatales archaeon]